MRVRFSFKRTEPLQYISHLDMMRLFQRALKRSGLPVAYSEGYNPHQRFNLALPLPVNVTAEMEPGELYLEEPVSPGHFRSVLQEQLPAGLELLAACRVEDSAPALPSLVDSAVYLAWPVLEPGVCCSEEAYRFALEAYMTRKEIWAERPKNKKHKGVKKPPVNVRSRIKDVKITGSGRSGICDEYFELRMLLQAGSDGGVSPFFVIDGLKKEINEQNRCMCWKVHRAGLCDKDGEFLQVLPGEK